MWRTVLGYLIAKTLGKAMLRLLISVGVATVTVKGGAEIVSIHPILLVTLLLCNVVLWVATVGSFVVAIIDLVKHW